MDAERVLIIILASTLSAFLLVAIVAIIKIIQILNHLKTITEKAQNMVNTAENIGQFFKHSTGAAALGNLVANVTDAIKDRKKKGRDNG